MSITATDTGYPSKVSATTSVIHRHIFSSVHLFFQSAFNFYMRHISTSISTFLNLYSKKYFLTLLHYFLTYLSLHSSSTTCYQSHLSQPTVLFRKTSFFSTWGYPPQTIHVPICDSPRIIR